MRRGEVGFYRTKTRRELTESEERRLVTALRESEETMDMLARRFEIGRDQIIEVNHKHGVIRPPRQGVAICG